MCKHDSHPHKWPYDVTKNILISLYDTCGELSKAKAADVTRKIRVGLALFIFFWPFPSVSGEAEPNIRSWNVRAPTSNPFPSIQARTIANEFWKSWHVGGKLGVISLPAQAAHQSTRVWPSWAHCYGIHAAMCAGRWLQHWSTGHCITWHWFGPKKLWTSAHGFWKTAMCEAGNAWWSLVLENTQRCPACRL